MKNKKIKRANLAVSEVLDVILLLGIAVSLFSVLSFIVLSYPFNPSTPSVNIIGFTEQNDIIVDHYGGERIDLKNKVIININNQDFYHMTIKSILQNYSLESVEDGYWDLGERLRINTISDLNPPVNITKESVDLTIVDINSNSVIFTGNLQGAS